MRRAFALLFVLATACMPTVTASTPTAGVVALFDPAPAQGPPVVPQPTDLAFQGGDGIHLNVPIDPTSPPAQQDLNRYLNTLDGFPGSLDGSTTFSAALAPADPKAAVVIDLVTKMALPPTAYDLKLSADKKTLSVVPHVRWRSGHQYAVGLFGGYDTNALRGLKGETVLASQTFFFLRSDKPLVAACGDGTRPGCACPDAVLGAMDPKSAACHPTAAGLDLATAEKAEVLRRQLAPAINALLTVGGPRKRSDLALGWTFTITTSPMAMFDPTRGDIPFPNDALIDQTTHKVNLPVAPMDPMAPIEMGLNTLDGFSTSAPATVFIDTVENLPPDAASVKAGALLANVTVASIGTQPTSVAAPVLVANQTLYAGQVAVQPTTALLSDQNRYAVVLTNSIHDGMGRTLVPSPAMVLLNGTNPLYDGTHTTVPALLDDPSAKQLETLRTAYQPLFALLASAAFGLPREKVVAVWTYTTQSINRPLAALDKFPAQAALPTGVTLTHTTSAADLAAAAPSLNYPTGNLGAVVFGTLTSRNVIDPATGVIGFDRTVVDPMDPTMDTFAVHPTAAAANTTIKFTLTLPAVAPVGGAPVVILQHGLTEWRGQTIVLADAFAAAGWATIAIDVNFHGARTICTDDTQCSGTCNKTTGVCSGGLKPAPPSMDPFACTLAPLSGDPTDCRPAASGNTFVNAANLFTSRDNLRQYVADAAQLVRVLQDNSVTGLKAQLAAQAVPLAIDNTQLAFLGQSLGAILGTLYLAVAPVPRVGYLSTVGGHDFEELGSGTFAALVDQYLMQIGVMKDTPQFFKLVGIARWILDPADPYAVGHDLIRLPLNAPKIILQQEDGMDAVIPDPFQEQLALELFGPMGLDALGHVQSKQTDGTIVSTFWPTANHGSLFFPTPSAADHHITDALQQNAVQWITTGGATITPPLAN